MALKVSPVLVLYFYRYIGQKICNFCLKSVVPNIPYHESFCSTSYSYVPLNAIEMFMVFETLQTMAILQDNNFYSDIQIHVLVSDLFWNSSSSI
jgi:hypothetical protein